MKLAQVSNTNPFSGIPGPATGPFMGFDINNGNIGQLVGALLPYVFGAAGIALLIYLILGGFQLITAQGDPKAIQGAQAKITNALIGFVIIIIAFTLTQLIGSLLGLQNTLFGTVFGIK